MNSIAPVISSPLLQPGQIGPLQLKNRVVMAPMTTRKADREGFVSDETIAYYEARARGGVGLIIVEMASPEKVGRHRFFELGIYDDRFLPGLKRLVNAIHAAGAKAAIQLGHGGGHTRQDIADEEPIAPSSVPHSVQEGHTEIIVPREMTRDQIQETIMAFARAAQRAGEAGFDAVEIHGAHGYLISQYMNHVENIRDDEYGGTLENRARFACEVTRAIKDRVPNLAVIFRMNGEDFFDRGMPLHEAVEIAMRVEQSGADALHMTGGHYRSTPHPAIMIPPMWAGRKPFVAFAQAVKNRVSIPVIAVGRLGHLPDAENALKDRAADFVALGRPLLSDPDWVRKVEAQEPYRACLGCNSCVDGMREGRELYCIVNPEAGRETLFAGKALVRQGQSIAVIGAGPAGLSYAALMARSNRVTLFEKADHVGGAFNFVSDAPLFQNVAPSAESFNDYIQSLYQICLAQGVAFQFQFDAVRDAAKLKTFDHIVVAAGAHYPWGTNKAVKAALRMGLLKHWPFRSLAENKKVRDYFYYKFRTSLLASIRQVLTGSYTLEAIGDALKPGRSEEAIRSAYEAAFGLKIVVNAKVSEKRSHDGRP